MLRRLSRLATSNPLAARNVGGAATSLRTTPPITHGASRGTDGALIHYKRVGHRSSPPRYKGVTSGCGRPIIRSIVSIAGLRSICQSVQNGQFLCRLAQDASDLFVASHTDKRIERLLANVVTTIPAIDQTPTLRPIEPADDCSAGHAHIGSNLGYRKRLTVNVAKRDA